jgi:hypothetical protein
LKKRTKKLLPGCRGLAGNSRARVFASFFQKEALSCFTAVNSITAARQAKHPQDRS